MRLRDGPARELFRDTTGGLESGDVVAALDAARARLQAPAPEHRTYGTMVHVGQDGRQHFYACVCGARRSTAWGQARRHARRCLFALVDQPEQA